MHSRFSYLAIASLAAIAFSGCEWGGAHENTWNDGYSWANFTGTYRFTKAVVYLPNKADTTETTTETTETTTAETTKYDTKSNKVSDTMDTDTSASGSVPAGDSGIVPGSFKLTVNGKNTASDSNKDGKLYLGSTDVGSVDYGSGSWSINSAFFYANKGNPISISYSYRNALVIPPVVDPDPEPGTYPGYSMVNLSYLNVTQQGNKLTMSGDSGVVYTGRLTGASTTKDGYVAAQTVRLSFEVSSGNGDTITGHFSGLWSGAADKNYGTLSNRQIHGTHSRAGNFVGTAADTTITVPTVEVNEFPTTMATATE